MATPLTETPRWFAAEFYLSSKLALLQATDPAGNWTRESMNKAFVEGGFSNPYDHYVLYGESEGLNPNAMFNANEYLDAKVVQLGSTWTREMAAQAIKDAGMTLAQHYVAYGSAEGVNPSKSFDQQKYLEAKVELLRLSDPKGEWTLEKVKEAFAANGITPLEHYMTYGKAEGLQDPKYDYAENGKPIPHPGNESIVLTTGIDVVGPDVADAALRTTSRDDVLHAVVSTSSTKTTLNPADSIDGAGGHDVLRVDMQGNFGGFKDNGGLKNVQTIVLDNAGGHTFDATGVVGAELYTLNTGAKASTIKNVDSAATRVELSADKSGAFTLQYTDAALAGDADNAVITLNTVGDAENAVNLKVGDTSMSSRLETLTLNSLGTGNNVRVESGAQNVAVTGSSDLQVTYAGAGLKSFDASAATGTVTANLSQSLGTLKSITGGEGTADVLRVSGLTPTPVTLKADINGFETLAFGATSNQSGGWITVDMTNVTGISTVAFEEGHNVVTLKGVTQTEMNLQVSDKMSFSSHLNYDGSGSLSVSSVGDSVVGYTTYTSLTANSITELHVANESASKYLNIGPTDAKLVETMTVDTGEAGVYFGSPVPWPDGIYPNLMPRLQHIQFTGNSVGQFTSNAVCTSLTSVDASQLQGELLLDLRPSNVSRLTGIEGGHGNDSIRIKFSAMASGGTIVGGEGADWIQGSTGNDIIYAGTRDGADSITTLNWEMMQTFNGGYGANIEYLTASAYGVLASANVIEGGKGDDTMYASNAKDVFLFQTSGKPATAGRMTEPSLTELGKDIIFGFNTKEDKLMLMDQDSWGVSGGADANHIDGTRGFSTAWEFETGTNANKLQINGAGGVSGGSGSLTYSIGNSSSTADVVVKFEGNDATIVIKHTVLAPASPITGDLTIKLAGVTSADISDGNDLAAIFGAATF